MTDNKAFEGNLDDRPPERMQIKQSSDDESKEVTRIIGSFGRWQLRIAIILSWCTLFTAQQYLVMLFFAPGVDHWCRPPEGLYTNWSMAAWKNYSLPPDEKFPEKFHSCKMYERDYLVVPEDEASNRDLEKLNVTDCMFGWDYDTSHFTHSLENQYNLVCDREVLAKTGSAVFNAGILFGAIISGQVSDIFGRKKTIMVALICAIISSILTSLMPILELFFVARFLLAMSLVSVGMSAFVLTMEYLDKKWRGTAGVYCSFPWVFGYLLLPGFAYLVPDWRHLQLLITLPIIMFLPFWWFVPESVRWLLSQGRIEEAEEIAKDAVRVNKRNVQVDLKSVASVKEVASRSRANVLDLFRFPKLRTYSLYLYYNWFVNSFAYYGLSLGTRSIGGELFVTFTIAGLVEIPTYPACHLVLNRYGRRVPYSVFMMVGGVACIATSAFARGVYPYDWPILALAMIGKFCITCTFVIIYIYSIEIYPTPVRNVGVGSCSMVSRIGSIIAPYVGLLRHVHPAIPMVLFGVAAVSAGGLALLLPETKDRSLPQTFEDAEK